MGKRHSVFYLCRFTIMLMLFALGVSGIVIGLIGSIIKHENEAFDKLK
jgi:hypothetical protein